MSRVLFVAFAVDASLTRRAGPLPFPVAARQIPRILAEVVEDAAGGEWDSSYLPIVGSDDGRRGFVTFEDRLPLASIESILGPRPCPDIVVTGKLFADRIEVEAKSTVTNEAVMAVTDIPFDPNDIRIALHRLESETWNALAIDAPLPALDDAPADALAFWLLGKDEELALQANLTQMSPQSPCAPWLAGLQRAPGNALLLGGLLAVARLVVERGGDTPGAVRALAHTAEHGACGDDWLLAAIDLASRAGCGEAFEALAIRYLASHPADAGLALRVGASLTGQGRAQQAHRILGACAESWSEVPRPEGPHILALLIDTSRDAGAGRDVERWARALRELDDIPADAAEVLARRLREQGRHDDAIEVAHRALRGAAHASGLYLELGRSLLLSGQHEAALPPLERAREGNEWTRREAERCLGFAAHPGLLDAVEQAETHLGEGRTGVALRLAKRCAKRAALLPQVWYLLGIARSRAGQRRRAIRALRRALALWPDFPEACSRLGILLVGTGRYAEGYAHLARALESDGEQLSPLLHMAQACYYMKRFDEGAALLAKAEELFPGHPAVAETRTTFYPIDA